MSASLEIIVRRVIRQRAARDTEAGRRVLAMLGESIDDFRQRSRTERSSIVRRIARRLAFDLRSSQRAAGAVDPSIDTAVIDPLGTIVLS